MHTAFRRQRPGSAPPGAPQRHPPTATPRPRRWRRAHDLYGGNGREKLVFSSYPVRGSLKLRVGGSEQKLLW